MVQEGLACEQALCLRKGWKKREEREGKWGKPVDKHLGSQHMTFTSCQNAAFSNELFSLAGRLCSGRFSCNWANVFFAAFSYCGVVTRILIFCGYCFWSTWFAPWCKNILFELFWNVKLFIAKLISQAPEDAILKIKRPVYERLFKSRATCRPKRRCKSNL